MDLIKTLDKMDLYVTCTVMQSQFPKEFQIPVQSTKFKNMERGDHKFHKYTYFDEDLYQAQECGLLVAWKYSKE